MAGNSVRLYWDLRWAFWDAREWLTVKWLLHYLDGNDAVYVHARNGGPAVAVVHRLGAEARWRAEQPDMLNHSHIEGH